MLHFPLISQGFLFTISGAVITTLNFLMPHVGGKKGNPTW